MSRAALLSLCRWLNSDGAPVATEDSVVQQGWESVSRPLARAGVLVSVPDRFAAPCPVGDSGCGLEFVHDDYETQTGERQVVRRCPKANGCGIRRAPATDRVAYALSAASLNAWLRSELGLEPLDSTLDEPGVERLGRFRHASGADHIWLIRALPSWKVAAAIARVASARGRARARVIVARPGGLGTESSAVAAAFGVDLIELVEVLKLTPDGDCALQARFPGVDVTGEKEVALVFTDERWRKPQPVTEPELAAIRATSNQFDLFIDEERDQVWRRGTLVEAKRYSSEWDFFFRMLGKRARFSAESLVDDPDRSGERLLRRSRANLDLPLGPRQYALVRTVKDGDLAMYELRPELGIRFALVFRLRTEPDQAES
jgi:hypothetical protein